MKKMMLIAIICLAMLSLISISPAAEAQVLKSYEGNLTEKVMANQINYTTLVRYLGVPGLATAEVTKFTAPKSGYKLTRVNILGYDGYNGSAESIPMQRIIALEVRDSKFNLLYKYADTQVPYTNFLLNLTVPTLLSLELPSVPVSGEFYICFFDRGAVAVGSEVQNKSTNTSFVFNEAEAALGPASLPISQTETVPVNWIMSVVGS
ncbi:MAG: hypothetical protein ACE14P_09475 [Methanotrichaceae archaeon]